MATVSSGPKPATSAAAPANANQAPAAPPADGAAPIAPAPARAARPGARRTTPAVEAVVPPPADAAPAPAARIPWYAAQVLNAAPRPTPTPTPTAPPTLSPRSSSVLRQVEARRATVWLNTQADEYDPPEAAEAPTPAIPGAYLAPSASFTAPVLRPRPGGLAEVHAATRVGSAGYASSATGARA